MSSPLFPPVPSSDVLAHLASSNNTALLPNLLHRGHHQIKFLDLMHMHHDLFGQTARTAYCAHPPQASHGQGLSYNTTVTCCRSTPTGFPLRRTRSAQKTHRETVMTKHIVGLRPGNAFLSIHITSCPACVHRPTASTNQA